MPLGAIEVDGLKQFQAAARKATDSDLPRRLGEAHRHIGELVISRLSPKPDPLAVGSGQELPRASASKRDVILRVGGAHRRGHSPEMQWGRRVVGRVGMMRPDRPFIRGTIDREYDQIADAYLDAISAAMSGAFAKTDP